MTRSLASLAFVCLSAISLHGSPALARPLQQPAERLFVETTKTKMTGTKTGTRPASAKAATPPKSTSTATAITKTDAKSGKRFWGRIMGAFRDVHSAEKRTAE